ncbi:hypothetical protein SPI_03676 [Niveomyces insectorum RCEF 264]|uniref:Uncharacterized protein n=1 Tax=Niveomyces insectorum RCEF 264 TaxID=1081102 RepID=A0A167W9T9_9HYPO|nr:hypothetical protein SPI_03676 [Niveomyces insectorum RCEF 264]
MLPELQKLWTDAQNRPEWAATRFWEYLFKQITFSGRQWLVASQQPPTYNEGDLRRVDLVVERVDGNSSTAALLFIELKRDNATANEIEDVVSAQKLGHYLTPIFPPGDGLSERDDETFAAPLSPRPANAHLPPEWHDNEVAIVTSPSAMESYGLEESGVSNEPAQLQSSLSPSTTSAAQNVPSMPDIPSLDAAQSPR